MRASFILAFYIVVRFFFFQKLDALGSYVSYIFEILFIATVLTLYRKRLNWGLRRLSGKQFLECLLALALGGLTYKAVVWQGIAIPFNFRSAETIVSMLIFGPILEEMLFRFALWYPFEDLLKQKSRVVIATALMFSFAHFFAYFYVPPLVVPFVLFQSVYTLLIGLWWGTRFAQTRSILVPILLHVFYNLGFYVGYLSDEPVLEFGQHLFRYLHWALKLV